MEGPSNIRLLYHEVQHGELCAVHCVNTVLQGPVFSEFDLAALASTLDGMERQMMLEGGGDVIGDFDSQDSHNFSLGGDFSIQVLQMALELWGLQVIPIDSPVAVSSRFEPETEDAFICHLHDHWFCIRKVNGEWYNFNSLYPAPEHLSEFYLSAYLDTLKGSGWSIFLVRGNFHEDRPVLSDDFSSGFGQWLTPEDAQRITKYCYQTTLPTQRPSSSSPPYSMEFIDEEDQITQDEEQGLNAAIQASLMDSSFQFGLDSVEDGQAAENATRRNSEFDGNTP